MLARGSSGFMVLVWTPERPPASLCSRPTAGSPLGLNLLLPLPTGLPLPADPGMQGYTDGPQFQFFKHPPWVGPRQDWRRHPCGHLATLSSSWAVSSWWQFALAASPEVSLHTAHRRSAGSFDGEMASQLCNCRVKAGPCPQPMELHVSVGRGGSAQGRGEMDQGFQGQARPLGGDGP